jgi:23S rRNA (adenine2503-C2)-methyltransferase
MGMGEPLLNTEAVVGAVERLGARYPEMLFSLSTVGIVPQIYALGERRLKLLLQVSLHAPNDALRSKIMPVNTKYPIAEVLKAARHYSSATGSDLYVNYLLLDGVNDSDECARELVALLKDLPAYTRIARYNSIDEIDLKPSARERHEAFAAICAEGGLNMYQFASLGVDIASGCGQLRSNVVRGSQLLKRPPRASH